MTLRVSGKNMDVGDALRGKAQDHVAHVVRKYFDGGYDGHLTLTPDGIGFHADCVVHLDTGATLQVSGKAQDPTATYEIVANNIEKRLRRYNRKLRSHRRAEANAEDDFVAQYTVFGGTEGVDELEEDYAPPVIAETTKNLRQMSVDEAVMELDFTGQQVVMFRHAGHGGLNVVYRRADGNIGWIDPALSAS
ncbi:MULTISPECIES: HPF/RaiA family ribosome-associated protein [unclassified Devosia]|uniref:ribosome hibernation promotion factor n=1 Tax=unclassified Devosia TaxID=196773 RepID=UPI00145DF9D6|nr:MULTISPECIES: HPF/RaiA family ribosome-associated protein [unclassified Devosia]MBJ6987121.1 HPF/RaiA family ribosome-associated protein [Devosia sp. MC521]MBJ7577317.1 HPF/RaiA family ribosome-associated protein [Devosia sp. MC532]MBK1795136.1 HPF/RaiA family ribosome-associated protein [Devosia sp. WQ 349K1]QMW62740.1 HPF/RaiA family ribosome-associated protein [Devosia sp. MC521]